MQKNQLTLPDALQEIQRLNAENKKLREQLSGSPSPHTTDVLQWIINSLPHSLYLIAADDFQVLFAKESGAQGDILIGKPCHQALYGEERPCAAMGKPCLLDEVRRTGKFAKVQHVHYAADGEKKMFEIFGYPVINEAGQVMQVFEYPVDVTDQHAAQSNAALNLARYRNIFNSVKDGLVIISTKDIIIDANPQMCKMFGYTYDEIRQLHGKELAPPEYHYMFENIRHDIIENGEFYNETIGVRKDGSRFNLEVKGTMYIDSSGHQMLGIMRDTTQRHKAEAEARLNIAKYKNVFNASSDGLVIFGFNDRILDANPRFCDMFGYTYEEVVQLDGRQLVSQEAHGNFKNILAEVQACGHYQTEVAGVRKDGSTFTLEVRIVSFVDQDKKQLLGIYRDITERRQFVETLQGRESDMVKKAEDLAEANAALKVLLQRRNQDRSELEELLMANFKELIAPYLESLMASRLTLKQKSCLEMVEANLNNIVSPFLKNLKAQYHDLTPAEIKVADLIRAGKRTKEIADMLGLSKRTIDFYRYNIRKKLHITENLSLTTFLNNLS